MPVSLALVVCVFIKQHLFRVKKTNENKQHVERPLTVFQAISRRFVF